METTMTIRDFDPSEGQAFQGDVAIVPIPDSVAVSTAHEIAPINGRLILQEGEVSGHHHAITLDRAQTAPADPKVRPRKTSRSAERLMADALAGRIVVPTARMYRDDAAVQELVRRCILTRADLAIGILVVEGGPMVVTHEEHDGIRLPVGRFYVGRQVESAGAEQRVVQD